ncbi:hypothetical protein [Rothia halotolerans]|uniref:hypothetical protein n=1 Tax=Rothia halotolerans TaxID=405770 RepID=UPI0013EC7F88|nr:hypothetical protein [Rothia halotolerans]
MSVIDLFGAAGRLRRPKPRTAPPAETLVRLTAYGLVEATPWQGLSLVEERKEPAGSH